MKTLLSPHIKQKVWPALIFCAHLSEPDTMQPGETRVLLKNHSDKEFVVEPGMRIAQGAATKCAHIEFEEVSELSKTSRAGGFGSTGVK